jgi:hypothetical protein
MLRFIKKIVRNLIPILVVLVSICLPLGTVSAKTSPGIFGGDNSIYAAEDVPAVPILTSPAYGSNVISLTTRLEWSPSPGTVSYNLQLSTDFNFANLIIDLTGLNIAYYDLPSLNKNTSYYWRVSASNRLLTSTWSSMGYFKTAFTFVPNAPDNLQANRVSQGRVDLSWKDNSDNEIRFVIERRTGQSSYSQINILNSNTTFYSDTSASDATIYYYRVKATGLAGDSAYSNEASTGPFLVHVPPLAPVITWPGEGYMIFTLEPEFQWQAVDGALSYTIQISADADFSNVIYSQENISSAFLDLETGILDWYHSYAWRVRAKGSSGISSDWSTQGSFTVEPVDQVAGRTRCSCGG